MGKKIFLLSDQVIHWNILPAPGRKNVYLEQWGNQSVQRLMDAVKTYFTATGVSMDWSLLDNGLEIQDLSGANPPMPRSIMSLLSGGNTWKAKTKFGALAILPMWDKPQIARW